MEISKRQKEILNSAKDFIQEDIRLLEAYLEGALWADKNPESKYNVSDTDRAQQYFESILQYSDNMTTGNMEHHRAGIRSFARLGLGCFKEKEGETT